MGERLDELRGEIPINADVQRVFEALDDPRRERLAEIIQQALVNQERRIDEASEHALRLVPHVFRGRVKKMLFGDHE